MRKAIHISANHKRTLIQEIRYRRTLKWVLLVFTGLILSLFVSTGAL